MVNRRYFSRFYRFKSKKTIDIQNVTKEKFPEAVGFMRRNFVDDPFLRAMGISERHKEAHDFLSALWLTLLRSELSLAAVHRKKICGLCINCPYKLQDGPSNDIFLQLSKVVKTEATRNLLHSWDQISREPPLPKQSAISKNKRVLELAGIAVDHDFRQLGIASRLVKSSADLAMLLGFEFVRIDCTNSLTSKICEKLGWEKVWEKPFAQFNGVLNDAFSQSEQDKLIVKVYIQYIQPKVDKS